MAPGDQPLPSGYTLVRPLGAGGFGEVVLARHIKLNRLVAIKRIHAFALSDDETIRRFQREAQLLARTGCESVVRVYDLVRQPDGSAQLVMEYVPGRPLSDHLAAGPLPAHQAIPILRDVAEALAFAAARGIVHRDVKPPNVFVLPDWHAKLGDFGLARVASDPSVFRTSAGSPLGTPAYYPPELSSTDAEPNERSDAYSFAVMAFEALTGRRPYEADDVVSLITAHWRLDPPEPGSIVPGFPPSSSKALLLGLSKDPAARLLPRELVHRLDAIPARSWPAVERQPDPVAPTNRFEPTVVTPGATPPPSPPARSPRGRTATGRRFQVVIGLALLAGAGLWGAASLQDAPTLRVDDVSLTSDPASGVLNCPGGEVRFVATFHTNGAAGSFDLQWTRPDGKTTPTRVITLEAGQRSAQAALRFAVSGDQSLSGDAVVRVLGTSGTSQQQGPTARRTLRYRCPG